MTDLKRALSPYRHLRALYLRFPMPFTAKRGLKDLIFSPIARLSPEASFLKEWQAKRSIEQQQLRYDISIGKLYGGEDELKLHSLQKRWAYLLNQPETSRNKDQLPELQRLLNVTHLNKDCNPIASVIIPCFGKAEYTLACLDSLTKQETTYVFEILIADDHPSDTRLCGYAGRINARHLHYYRNTNNLGFTKNVNHAALRAQGEYLIILNNDTYCHPLWLENLLQTYRLLSTSNTVGVIGSKVLHSNMQVQESGCLMHPGGAPYPIGRGAHCFDPRYSYLREVDFVSACSLLIQKRHFLDGGGFDERFSPGYFEDPDLCERLRLRGLKSYVQPASILLHEEGVSFGKNGFSAALEEKKALFNTLHPSPVTTNISFEAQPRLLFIDAYLPMADKGSGGVDAMAYLEYFLAKGFQPVFYAHHHNNYFEKYTQELERIGVEVIQDNFKGLDSILKERATEFTLVFVSRFYQMDHFHAQILRHLCHANVIYNTVDLHYLREGREAQHSGTADPGSIESLKKKELGYIARADASIVISAHEFSILKNEMPSTETIHHIPQYRQFIGTSITYAERRGFVFIGSAHNPNVDALRYFQKEIHPCLIERLPDYELVVIGKELYDSLSASRDRDLLANSHIHFTGYVEDVTLLFNCAICMVAPLRYGSGIKGKIVQSIQHALPCVTTTIGAEGLELPGHSTVVVADTPAEMADALQAFATRPELWAKASSMAEPIFEARFSKQIFSRRLDILMAQLQQISEPDLSSSSIGRHGIGKA
jgi:O-antigen biosynthesis protein